MKYNADSFFTIGKSHTVCQDYARTGSQRGDGMPFAVLCDGCSASPDSDMGARFLALAAASEIQTGEEESISLFNHYTLKRASASLGYYGLPLRALDATLLTAQVEHEHSRVRVRVQGDGVVVCRKRTGFWDMWLVEHPQGAPRYLSYDQEPNRLTGYRHEFGEETLVNVYSFTEEGRYLQKSSECQGNVEFFAPAEEYDLVLLLSDGVSSFQQLVATNTSRHLTGVPAEEVISHLLKIKSFTGQFLQRRCRSFLTKFCTEHNWQHYDDFSAAAIWMGES